MHLMQLFIKLIKKHPRLTRLIKKTAKLVSPETVIILEYSINPKQRWNLQNPHEELYEIINQNRDHYKATLQLFLEYLPNFAKIPVQFSSDSRLNEPYWINGWMPALDGVALYSFIAINKPGLYLEVGSGISTKFAHLAISDQNLSTRIVSIDPYPRTEIDELCSEVIRQPLEDIDLEIFKLLERNDILYIDNSHTVFMNSDSTVFFLEVLPKLKSGVIVEVHDITLPYDYPLDYLGKYYAEQYLLAAYLLGKGDMFEIILPNMFISYDDELKNVLAPLWGEYDMKCVETHGCSFWLRKR